MSDLSEKSIVGALLPEQSKMTAIVPFDHQLVIAEAFAKSGLFGIKTKEQAIALMAICEAEGLHPARAAQEYHIIQGRPTLKADAMLARFQSSGGKVEWREYTDERVTGVFSHPQGGSVTLSWEIAQAKRIGLYKPGSGWEKYPRAMLRARVISEGIRTVYPGCIAGTYTPEEAQDFQPAEKDITPTVTVTTFDDLDDGPKIVEETKKPSMNLELRIPGKDGVFAHFDTVEEYTDAIVKVAERIKNSDKLDAAGKDEKLAELKELNKATFKKVGLGEMTRILGAIAKAGANTEEKPQGSEG